MEYGNKLNPGHLLRMARGIKETRWKVIVTHSHSEINQNELLLVRFLNLGCDDVIVLGMANLFFNIDLSLMADTKRALMSNVQRFSELCENLRVSSHQILTSELTGWKPRLCNHCSSCNNISTCTRNIRPFMLLVIHYLKCGFRPVNFTSQNLM